MYYTTGRDRHYRIERKRSIRVSEREIEDSKNNLNRFSIKDLKKIANGYNREVIIKNIGKLGKDQLIEEIVKAAKKFPYFHQRMNGDLFKLIKYFEETEDKETRDKEMKKIDKVKQMEEKLKEKEKKLKEKEKKLKEKEKKKNKTPTKKTPVKIEVVRKSTKKTPVKIEVVRKSTKKTPVKIEVVRKSTKKTPVKIEVVRKSTKKKEGPKRGDIVKVIIKPYEKKNYVNGIVKQVLTKSTEHKRGIKVKLQDGTVGRIVKILKPKK